PSGEEQNAAAITNVESLHTSYPRVVEVAIQEYGRKQAKFEGRATVTPDRPETAWGRRWEYRSVEGQRPRQCSWRVRFLAGGCGSKGGRRNSTGRLYFTKTVKTSPR